MTVVLQAPSAWPFNSPVVPARFMPSGNSYRVDSSNQIAARDSDVAALLGYGFTFTVGEVSGLTGNVLPMADAAGSGLVDSPVSVDAGTVEVAAHLEVANDCEIAGTLTNNGQVIRAVLIDSGSVSAAVEFFDVLLPAEYSRFSLKLTGFFVSAIDAIAFALSVDGGTTFYNDSINFDSYFSQYTLLQGGPGPTTVIGQAATDALIAAWQYQDPAADIGSMINLDISPGAAGLFASMFTTALVFTESDDQAVTQGATIVWPSSGELPGRVNLIRVQPYGNGDCNPPTSGETITAGSWALYGVPS